MPSSPKEPECAGCQGTGRALISGVSQHCACPLGRAMAQAHWVEKALEEARG